MTRRPQISITPIGLAYISGDWHDRDSAHHAEHALRAIWADLDRAVLTAALNHPDAPGLFADDDPRPWEPLAPGDPLHAGDEVKRVAFGATITAVVGRVDPEGDPWTAEDGFIGRRRHGAWHVRRLQDITLDTWKVDDQ